MAVLIICNGIQPAYTSKAVPQSVAEEVIAEVKARKEAK